MKQQIFTQTDRKNHVKNLSAYWLPELTLCRKIGGTIYSVSGTYEGMETPDRKLRRIMEHSFESGAGHP